MNKFKYLSVMLLAALLAGAVMLACSNNDLTPKEEGYKAGLEMCACLSIPAPEMPEPPADFDPDDPDLEDPDVLEYLAKVEAYYEDVLSYLANLGECATLVAAKYQKYFIFDYDKYEGDLFDVFEFKDEEFQQGFLEAAMICAEGFTFS
ncbi:MAG: hypothetical protein FWH23_02545 [Bacteroidales bacterium]|nr:hypothetical protein [Bacteroidales bacterium]MCL2133875.1 hypothetical protein [Bacteroidales bacterium]